MLKVNLTSHAEENYPGNLTEVFEAPNLIGWLHWEGPPNIVTPDILETIVAKIKINPQIVPNFPPNTKFSLALISGSNENAHFQFLGNVALKIIREGKTITLSQNSIGKLKESDQLSFISTGIHTQSSEPTTTPSLPPTNQITNSPTPLQAAQVTNHQFLSSIPPPQTLILKGYDQIKSKFRRPKMIYLALVVFLIIIASILWQLRNRTAETRQKVAAELTSEAQKQLSDDQLLGDLNTNLARSQLERDRESFLAQAEKSLGPNWQKDKSAESQKLLSLLGQFDSALTSLQKIYKLGDLAVFYDTTILKPNSKVSAVNLVDDALTLLDDQTGTVFGLDVTTKAGKIVTAQDKFKKGQSIGTSGDQSIVLNPEGIIAYPKGTTVKRSDQWGNIAKVEVYGGNIYLLDPSKNAIWKYISNNSGFSDIKSYLAKDLAVDLSQAVDFTIDGDVYVLTSTGHIAKFSGGTTNDFTIKGLDLPFKDPKAIFTSDKAQNIYVLDSGNSRVVVLDKKGNYVSQYILPGASSEGLGARLLADESVKKIFLFGGSKIYGIDIR